MALGDKATLLYCSSKSPTGLGATNLAKEGKLVSHPGLYWSTRDDPILAKASLASRIGGPAPTTPRFCGVGASNRTLVQGLNVPKVGLYNRPATLR